MSTILPFYEEARAAVLAGKSTALQRFIHEFEPAGSDDIQFRVMLQDVIDEALKGDTVAPPEDTSAVMSLDELTAAIKARFGKDFVVCSSHKNDGSSECLLYLGTTIGEIKDAKAAATWKSRLKNRDVPRDGVTPRGESEYYDLKFL